MENTIFKKALFILFFLIISCYGYAQISKTIGLGEAIIENSNMKAAYKTAIQNALLDAIREYYVNASENGEIPDVTPEYIKFIKSYKITSRNIDDFKVFVSVEAYLDNVTIKDPKPFLTKRLDTIVFMFSNLPEAVISDSEISKTMNNVLQAQNFSTMDQNNFAYLITDPENKPQIINAFNSVGAKYLLLFSFVLTYPEHLEKNQSIIDEPTYTCEITVNANLRSKQGKEKKITLSINSGNKDRTKCAKEAMNKGLISLVEYLRTNILLDEATISRIHSYQIKVINFKNMVNTNKFFESLKQKGFVNSYKVTSFASKEVLFNVETIFEPTILQQKITDAGLNQNIIVKNENNGLVLDFSPINE